MKRTAVAAIGVPTILFTAHASRMGGWIVDDAAISFAYARSLADGHGFVQQPGAEAVEGYSNPLWTLTLAVLHRIGLFDSGWSIAGVDDYVLAVKAGAIVLFAATLGVLLWALRPVLDRAAWVAVGLAGLILAAIPSYVIWAVSGLENPLYGFVVATLAAVLTRAVALGRLLTAPVAAATGGLTAAAALTRPDGAIYVLAYPIVVACLAVRASPGRSVRMVLLSGGAAAAPMALFLVHRWLTFGALLPNTAVAKAQGFAVHQEILKILDLGRYLTWSLTAAMAIVVVLSIVARGRLRTPVWPAMLPVAVCGALAGLAFGVLAADWMGHLRFATPVWVTAAPLFAACLVSLADRRVVLLCGAASLSALLAFSHQTGVFAASPTVPMCYVADRFGRTFNEYADRLGITSGTLAAPDVGGTLLTTRLRLVDTAGLTDATIARARGARDLRLLADYVYDQVRPTFIHMHEPWDEGLAGDPRLIRDYEHLGAGDYVRRAAVADVAVLDALRALRLPDRPQWNDHRCGPLRPTAAQGGRSRHPGGQ